MEEIFCIHYSMKIFSIILLLLFCLSIYRCSPSSKVPPKAVNGVLDLRDWDFEKDGIVNLDGEWEFYWKEVPSKESFDLPKEKMTYISVPKSWNGTVVTTKGIKSSTDQEKIKGEGFASYRLKILLNQKVNLGLKLTNQSSSYDIYLNQKLFYSSGKFGTNVLDSIPSRNTKYLFYKEVNEDLNLIITISNFHHSRGGFWNSILIGGINKINDEKIYIYSYSFFIIGILFIIGVYHISIFTLNKYDKSTLYFGLFCIIFCVRLTLTDEKVFFNFYEDINYSVIFKVEYLTVPFAIILFLKYFYYLYSSEMIKNIDKFFQIIVLLWSFIVVSTPPSFFTGLLFLIQIVIVLFILYCLYITRKVYIQLKEGMKVNLIGYTVYSITILNDILVTQGIINGAQFSSIGFVSFIFAQSYLLSSRFSKAFQDVAELSHTLKSSNQELELTKERATRAYLELEASQKQLVQSDKMITLGTMLAGVAHEINTPLGAIKANSENILESLRGLILKLNPSLSHLTLDELQASLRILELSKESTTPFSSREARALRKKVISLLEERNLSNVDLLTDFIVELNLVEALERKEEILFSPGLEKVLSLAYDLHGIRKKSTVIQTSAERVSKIVKSLKSFMHFDQNEKKVPADLTEGMETVLIILHNKIKMGIEVTKNYGEDVPQILCFPDELNQVWTNLIHNAIQAMDEKGSLQIDIEKVPNPKGNPDIDKRNPNYTGEYISVSIQDSGSGIPPEIREKIFQAFFTTKPAGEGSGLGLHIIGKILEKHEGALYLESEPGRTRFSVLLPLG
jgi:two-component system, NtrC family, sensor kinase